MSATNIRCTRLTAKGRTLLDKCQTGEKMKFTKVVMGNGTITDTQDIRQLTGLVNPVLTLPMVSNKITGVGTLLLETRLNNADLTKGFFASEVGIFADDPDNGEILYAVRNTGANSEYVPAGGGSEVWDLIYNWIVVIDDATNVTAVINGDIIYATQLDLTAHINDTSDPHKNWLQKLGELASPDYFWTHDGDKNLHYTSADDVRTKILGNTSTIPVLSTRVSQLEIEQGNIALKQVAENACPNSNLRIAEDFKDPDMIDRFSVQVTSVVAGDNGIDVESVQGIIKGAWYSISDGVSSEYLQVQDVIRNGEVYRLLICTDKGDNIVNTYNIPNTKIYRTTSKIDTNNGIAYGSGDKKGFKWKPSTVWQGVNANVASVIKLETTQANADAFDTDGDVAFTSDGLFTLATD